MTYGTISLLSDYGLSDESIGLMKSVIRTIAPQVTVIDITHDIPRFDVRTGAVVLARSALQLAPGVVVASVGDASRDIAVEVGDGESVLLGPDNGLLAPVVAVCGGATRVIEIKSGYNFDQVAAQLCNGVSLSTFGPFIDAGLLMPATIPFSEEREGELHADVIYVDHFGNLHLNVEPEQVEAYGDTLRVTIDGNAHNIARTDAYVDRRVGEPMIVVDDAGLMAIAVNQASAADYFKAAIGSTVTLKRVTVL